MLSAEWPKASCIGKRRKREERKKERKEKKEKKEEKKKKEKKKRKRKKKNEREKRVGEANKQTKKHGGVSSDSVYFKSLDFPWNLSVQLVFWGRGLLC